MNMVQSLRWADINGIHNPQKFYHNLALHICILKIPIDSTANLHILLSKNMNLIAEPLH